MPIEVRHVRLRVEATGTVQGVGFRPFVHRLASELGLCGWVTNTGQGICVEVEASRADLELFLGRLQSELPPLASFHSLEYWWLDPADLVDFRILESLHGTSPSAIILPDIATCADCLEDISDSANRRYRYPFTNCTNCGPRFSIIQGLPYDRERTTMAQFAMCHECLAEYQDPSNRRFHAQPNACPACGPQVQLWDRDGRVMVQGDEAIVGAARAILEGMVVAVKGIGGFHLMADAGDAEAVAALRIRKNREFKPLALMTPHLDGARALCVVRPDEELVLKSPAAPLVLMERRRDASIADGVAPDNPYLAVMLPYSPLHHLLMDAIGKAVVATSGNRADEPICTGEHEALIRLNGIADLFLVHDRPIARHVDDSIVRVGAGRQMVLRRARGFAPMPVRVKAQVPESRCVLAVGAHLKNTIAISRGSQVFMSQHIGDLETPEALNAFHKVIGDLAGMYGVTADTVASDLHPDYLSTQAAAIFPGDHAAVQHHLAHVLACMADNDLQGSVLGVSWDGTGLGTDGSVWGGEFLVVRPEGWTRAAHIRHFKLPGGDKAVREPRRSALGLAYELGMRVQEAAQLDRLFNATELQACLQALERGVNCPTTSSMGRLFDGLAALVGLAAVSRFEGEAAMALEFAAFGCEVLPAYSLPLIARGGPLVLDWGPAVREALDDLRSDTPVPTIAAKFHNGLAEAIVSVAKRLGVPRVALTGGCFQNKLLLETAIAKLHDAGLQPYWHQRVPTNDGGIALGQISAVLTPREEIV